MGIDEIVDFIKSSPSAQAAASKKKKKKKKDCQKAKKFEAEAEAVGDKKKGNIPNHGNDDEGRKSEEFPEQVGSDCHGSGQGSYRDLKMSNKEEKMNPISIIFKIIFSVFVLY